MMRCAAVGVALAADADWLSSEDGAPGQDKASKGDETQTSNKQSVITKTKAKRHRRTFIDFFPFRDDIG